MLEIQFYLANAKKYGDLGAEVANEAKTQLEEFIKLFIEKGKSLSGSEALLRYEEFHGPLFLLRNKVRNAFFGDVFTSAGDKEYELDYCGKLGDLIQTKIPGIDFHSKIKDRVSLLQSDGEI